MRLPWKRREPTLAPDQSVAPQAAAAPDIIAPPIPAGTGAPDVPCAPGLATPPVDSAAAPAAAAVPVPPAVQPEPAPVLTPALTPAQRMAAAAAASAELPPEPPVTPTPAAPPALEAPAPATPAPGEPAPPASMAPAAAPAPPARRRGLVPRWAPWAAGALGAVVLIAVVLALVLSRSDISRVPSLTGLDRKAAATRLQELGLTLVVGDQRFSASAPVGSIIDQSPAAGTQVRAGTAVTVALSAGSESFPMPDVTGQLLDSARKKLRDRGLSVEFQTVPSDKDQGTVISSVPSPGATVMTGDTVRLTVAAGTSGSDTLLPSDLKGKTFVLDPAPMPVGGGADATMDVARRVRALLEASGARVVVTRSITDTGDAANTLARSKRAKEASGTALVGFGVTQSGASGLAILSVPNTSTTQPTYMKSLSLTQALTDTLKSSFPGLSSSTAENDVILNETGIPAVRIRLGSIQSGADKLSFTDPEWADNVAKAVYRAIAQVYGTR